MERIMERSYMDIRAVVQSYVLVLVECASIQLCTRKRKRKTGQMFMMVEEDPRQSERTCQWPGWSNGWGW